MGGRGVPGGLCIAALVALAPATQGWRPQVPDVAIVFESPGDESYVSGPSAIRVRVAPAGAAVRTVSLFADGRLICTLERPPYECPWDAGPRVTEHVVRATAQLGDGRQIRTSIRTKGVEYTESVDVDVVQITATVTGSRGRFVRGLKSADFRIYEDGIPQTITGFAAEDIPLEIIVAIDVSGSMATAMPTVRSAVGKFLSKLRPQDKVTVLGFNDNVFVVARPTVVLQDRLKVLERLKPWGGTALYDAMLKAMGQLGPQAGRRAIVVFTDGEDLNSRIPQETAERGLESSDAVLYAIGQGRAPGMQALRNVLERLSEKTGGRAFFEDLDKLGDVFDTVIADLANQYLIGYVPQSRQRDGRWREIRIEVPDRDYKIRARKGYRATMK
jgi:VWFA-related protein